MKTIIGLGNPGQTYHETRHNAGFMVIQWLAERHRIALSATAMSPVDQRPAAVFGDAAEAARQPMRLAMPLTMMNESGEALRVLNAEPSALLIVCDDVNLPLGAIRLRPKGSAGGHHGLDSCLAALGTEDVSRLRVGVGVEPLPRDLETFVLCRFQSAERPLIRQAVEWAGHACEAWAEDGIEIAMNRYNRAQVGG